MGSQGWLRTGGTPLPRPLSEKAKAQESEGLCKARELESCGAPDPLTVAEGRGREKGRTGGLLRGPVAADLDSWGPMRLPTQHTCCRSCHTMHVVSREPEMR